MVGPDVQLEQQGQTDGGKTSVAPPNSHQPVTRMVDAMLAKGQHEPEAYAGLLRQVGKHLAATTEILAALHGSLGNAFVRKVLEASGLTSAEAPKSEAAAGTHAPGAFRVTPHRLNVRGGASNQADIVGSLQRGAVIDVTGNAGTWMMITYAGQPAYVHADYVEPATPAAVGAEAADGPPTTKLADDTAQAPAKTAAQGTLDGNDSTHSLGGDKPATPAPTSTASSSANTMSPVGALTPADLHNETLEHMIATLNDAQVTAIGGELAGLRSKSKQLKAKASRKEEQGQGRNDLVEGIRVLRARLDALDSAQLDKQQVKAFKTAVYHALNEIAPYYFQARNIDILETPPPDKTRTCNLTCLGMALESIGCNATMFTGSQEAVVAAARVYQHKIVGDDVSDPAHDATGGRGASWGNLTGMRFPDFLELVAIANEMKGDMTVEGVKAGAKIAWDSILEWRNLVELAKLFKVSATQKLFDVTGTKDNKKKNVKHDYKVLKAHGDKNRMAVEKYINAKNMADETGKQTHKDKAEQLRPAYEAAIADTGMDSRVDLEGYREHVIEHIGADLDAGCSVIVGLSGHFVRLQSIHEDHVLVNDPARDSRSLTKLSFAEARAMGYFATRFVLH
jgi:hypothetical protein